VETYEDLASKLLKASMIKSLSYFQLDFHPVMNAIVEILINTFAIYSHAVYWAVFFLPTICASLVVYDLSQELTKKLSHSISSETFEIHEVKQNHKTLHFISIN